MADYMAGKKPQGRIQEASQSVGSIATINKEPLIGFMKGSRKWRLPTLTKEFYVCSAVRAEQTRAAHLLQRMFPGHSRCALTASPHNACRPALRHGRVRETAQEKRP